MRIGVDDLTLLSESGLYKFIMRSDKPEARPFQDWVIREVLSAIRNGGAYVMGEEKVATVNDGTGSHSRPQGMAVRLLPQPPG